MHHRRLGFFRNPRGLHCFCTPSPASESLEPRLTPAALGLDFSTFLGGSQSEQIRDVTTDAVGNIYVTGGTESPDFPVTAGAYQTAHNPGTPENTAVRLYDVFVAKLSSQGVLLWSTLLGGPNYDRAYAIELDPSGNVLVAGRAGAGFPVTTGAFQTQFQGGQEAAFYGRQDGFIARLSPDGSQLLWASYFGTSDAAIVRDIDVDAQGDVYLASSRSSGSYPAAVAGAFASGFGPNPIGGRDAVVAKVAGNGSQVLWASYVGGTSDEGGTNSVRVDAQGQAHLLFGTQSTNAPATPNAYDRTLGGTNDVFVAKVSTDGRQVLYGTYLGGSLNEGLETHELALDAQGRAVVATGTTSSDFPTTPGAFQRTYGGTGGSGTGQGTNYPGDIFVARLALDGSQLLASTYVGGRYGESAEGIGIDDAGNISISGATFSDNFPTTAGAFGTTRPGGGDVVLVKLSADLSTLLYSTYLGGSSVDYGRTAWADRHGNVYVAGETSSTNWPRQNALQSTYRGNGDGALAKFSVPAAVAAVMVNDGAVQRSSVKSITITFDSAVVLDPGAITLIGRNGAGSGAVVQIAPASGLTNQLVLTFSGTGVIGGSLPDDIYDLRIVAASVHAGSTLGPAMAADYAFAFHRLFSDADGDGDSDNVDLFHMRGTYGRISSDPAFRWYFDYDGDNDVDNADVFQVRGRRAIQYVYVP